MLGASARNIYTRGDIDQRKVESGAGSLYLEMPVELRGQAKLECFLERNPAVPFLQPAVY